MLPPFCYLKYKLELEDGKTLTLLIRGIMSLDRGVNYEWFLCHRFVTLIFQVLMIIIYLFLTC